MVHRRVLAPIVATALILIITVSLTLSAYFLFSGTVARFRGTAEESLEEFQKSVNLEVVEAYWYDYRKNLILELRFDEEEENIARDYSGYNNNGVLHGVYALSFDGTDDYIALPYCYGKAALSEVTVCAWVKSSSKARQIIVSFDRSEVFRLALIDDVGTYHVGWDTTDESDYTHDLGTPIDYADGNWHLVCGWYKAGASPDKKIFVDGEVVASATAHGGKRLGAGVERPCTYGFIGVGSEASTFDGSKWPLNWFNGTIAEVRIYHRALTDDEIKELYEKGPCYDRVKDGLALWLCLDKEFLKDSNTIRDLSGNGNDGTISGATFVEIGDLPKAYNRKWVEGRIKYAINFDGKDDFVQSGNNICNGCSQMSIVLLFNPRSCYNGEILVNKENEYEIGLNSRCNIMWAIETVDPAGWYWVTTNLRARLNQWNFVALVYNGTAVITYNGTHMHIYPYNMGEIESKSTYLRVAARWGFTQTYTPGSPFNGIIDEVRIYDTALSSNILEDLFYRIHMTIYNTGDTSVDLNNAYVKIGDCIEELVYNKIFITNTGSPVINPNEYVTVKIAPWRCHLERGRTYQVCLLIEGERFCDSIYVG